MPAARAMATPIAAADSRVRTTPRRSGSSRTRAPASTAYCQGWVSSRVRVTAEPRIAPIAAGRRRRGRRGRAGGPDLLEAGAAEQDDQEGRGEGDGGGEQAPGEPGGGVADDRNRLHNGPGRDLAERDRVEELGAGHPVVAADHVGLHQRDDDEPAAERQPADLERLPRHRREHPAADREHQRGGDEEAAELLPSPGAWPSDAPPVPAPARLRDRSRARSSTAPQPSSTSTSQGPMVAAAASPAAR